MRCEILCIGDELLIGQVVNTNAAWLGRELTAAGVDVGQTVCIPDDKEAIVDALKTSMARSPWVFMTGGLGPTKDDLTRSALLEVFGGEMVFSEPTWEHLVRLITRLGKDVTPTHREQCFQPSTAQVLHNAMGTAPGLYFNIADSHVCVMPGVPFEMEYLMTTHFLPMIRAADTGRLIITRTVATAGIGETVLSDRIADIENALPGGIRIAYLPSPARVRIRVSGSGNDAAVLTRAVEDVAKKISERLAEFVFATEDISLSEAIGRQLRDAGKSVSVAESCTGGFLGHLFTAVPDSSDYFIGGAITYSNQMKQDVLGVQKETLDLYGAVSAETVIEMASGARDHFHSDYALAVSGIAGPSGGTPDKPVGTVWIAVADTSGVDAQKFTFGKDRLRNIEFSAVHALDMLRRRMRERDNLRLKV